MTTEELIELLVNDPGELLWCFRDKTGAWFASLQRDALSPDHAGASTLREALASALNVAAERQAKAIESLENDAGVLEEQLACKRAKLSMLRESVEAAKAAIGSDGGKP